MTTNNSKQAILLKGKRQASSVLACTRQYLYDETTKSEPHATSATNSIIRNFLDLGRSDLTYDEVEAAYKQYSSDISSVEAIAEILYIQGVINGYIHWKDNLLENKVILGSDKSYVVNLNDTFDLQIKVETIFSDPVDGKVHFLISYASHCPYNKTHKNLDKSIHRQDITGIALNKLAESLFPVEYASGNIQVDFVWIKKPRDNPLKKEIAGYKLSNEEDKVDRLKRELLNRSPDVRIYEFFTSDKFHGDIADQQKALKKELEEMSLDKYHCTDCSQCDYRSLCSTRAQIGVSNLTKEKEDEDGDVVSDFTSSQIQAITNEENKYQRVIAGPGSGKTRTLVAKCAYLIEMGIDPKEILLTTFSNAAADEMRDRILATLSAGGFDDDYIEEVANALKIQTIHAYAFDVVKEYKDAFGFKKEPKVVNMAEMMAQIEESYNELSNAFGYNKKSVYANNIGDFLGRSYYNSGFSAGGGYTILRELFLDMRSRIIAANPIILQWDRKTVPTKKAMLNQKTLIRKYFKDRNYLAFKALDGSTSFGKIMSQIEVDDPRNKDFIDAIIEQFVNFHLFMMKEAYVTYDEMQYLFISLYSQMNKPEKSDFRYILVDESQDLSRLDCLILNLITQNTKELKQIFLVGDPRQAIYGFRNAGGLNINVETQDRLLTYGDASYTKIPVVELVENFRSTQEVVEQVNALTDEEYHLFNKRYAQDDIDTFNSYKPLISKKKKLSVSEDEFQGFRFVKNLLNRSLQNFVYFFKVYPSAAERSVIIANTNAELESIADYLVSQNIPFHFKSSLKLGKTPLVGFILGFLKAILYQDKNTDWALTYLELLNGLDWVEQKKVDDIKLSVTAIYEQVVNDSKTQNDMIPWFLDELNHLNDSSEQRLSWWIDYLKENIQQISEDNKNLSGIDILKTIERNLTADLKYYTESFSKSTKNDRGVELTTVHGAKGLEYDYVIYKRRKNNDQLFIDYVALSRAKVGVAFLE